MATEKDKRGSRSSGKSSEDRRGSGGLKMTGRFPPGTRVRLTKSAGPHQMRPGPGDEEVDAQSSATIRGSATPVSDAEREWARRQWRKQEPTNPLLEVQEDPESATARTGEQPDYRTGGKGD
jgi:hypothetical protein